LTRIDSRPRGPALAIALLALAACAPAAGSDEPPPQQRGALPAVGAAGREDFPATDSTLSLLEPHGARCAWVKLDAASGRRRELSTFAGGCRGGRIALAADGMRGAVWFDPAARSSTLVGQGAFPEAEAPAGSGPRLFAVELATGAAAAVPLPAGTRDLGFDSRGRMIALTVQELTAAETDKGQALVDGKTVKLEPAAEGVPVLVHAFVFHGGADGGWQRRETANSTDGWDLALGVLALRAAQDLAFRSAEVLAKHVQGDDENDQALLAKLAGFAPQAHPAPNESGWIRFGAGATRFVLWEASGEFAYATGLAAFVDAGGNPVKPPAWPYTENDVLSYVWNGPYLLAAEDFVGSHPRLYRDGRLVWSSDAARAVTFWPRRPRGRRAGGVVSSPPRVGGGIASPPHVGGGVASPAGDA
jgi:hypothetical protein